MLLQEITGILSKRRKLTKQCLKQNFFKSLDIESKYMKIIKLKTTVSDPPLRQARKLKRSAKMTYPGQNQYKKAGGKNVYRG